MTGMILLWSGSLATIPDGWHLCDGTEGTPNLQNKFILGAGSGYAPGATGGAGTHLHSVAASGTHSHTLPVGTDIINSSPSGNLNKATGTGGSHTHTTGYTSSLPPYYALAYIMKL